MVEALSIKRRNKAASPLDFDSLRSEAIKQIELLSGQVWSDYNLHDPGITILEQLIYATTDLIYRTDFDIEDLLADEKGEIDLEALNLHAPFDIFPCRATTLRDYRKLLLDAVPALDNVWIADLAEQEGDGEQYRGLYRLALKLAQNLDESARSEAIEQVRATYLDARNLCEDIGEIIVVDTLEYQLCADVEISGIGNPVDTLAEIYFECARRIASSVTINSYDQAADQELPLDQLFEGPRTRYGYFKDEDLREHQSQYLVSNLISTINSIEAVDHIRELHLTREGERFYDRIGPVGPDQAFDLLFPDSQQAIEVVLTSSGRELPIAYNELAARFHEMSFKYHSSRSVTQDMSLLCDPVTGVSRPLAQYFSIQNHFPLNYGINQFGVPASASSEVKARARQLKAYLLIFEQLLNNFLANLGSVKTLYSSQLEARRSYATQALKAEQVNDLSAVYPQQPDSFLDRVVAGFDNFSERKNRLLDYLLALYGEEVNQTSFRQFNFYHDPAEIDAALVAHKVAFLEAVVELGRDRVAAADYSSPVGRQRVNGATRRVSMLLEFEQHAVTSLTGTLREQGIVLCSHPEYLQRSEGSEELRLVALDDIDESAAQRFEKPLLIAADKNVSLQTVRGGIAEIPLLKDGFLSDLLLTEGIFIERYRVGYLAATGDWQLMFQLDPGQYWCLAGYADKSAAMRAANELRRYLILLNRSCEGLHMVEHILLRPELRLAEGQQDDDFYSFRVSVIFPGWTARCRDRQFRLFAEETLRLNVPAHVFAEFYWLDFEQMIEFEALYTDWQSLKSDAGADAAEIDRCSGRLKAFLLEQRKTQQTGSRLAPL